MHRKVAVAFVAALAVGAASCGGSEPLTRAELVSQVASACREAQDSSKAEMRSATRRSGDDAGAAMMSVMASRQQDFLDRVGDLEPSERLQAALDAYEQQVKQRRDLLQDATSDLRARGEEAMAAFARKSAEVQERVRRAAQELGVKDCL